jgi:hypothetical protein
VARVKSFEIDRMVPDKDIKNFIDYSERFGYVNVSVTFIPAMDRGINPRVLVITTKLDELGQTILEKLDERLPQDNGE